MIRRLNDLLIRFPRRTDNELRALSCGGEFGRAAQTAAAVLIRDNTVIDGASAESYPDDSSRALIISSPKWSESPSKGTF